MSNKLKTWQKLKNNPELFNRYYIKEYIIKAARKFFEKQGYHEFESPILSSSLPQERYLEILKTDIKLAHGASKIAYLIPSTETFNKRILAAGLGNHFVISKVFRGLEEIGPNHSPEFTMLEWYHLEGDYFDLMEDCEQLVLSILKYIAEKQKKVFKTKVRYQGREINLKAPWHRISIPETLKKSAGLELEEILTLEKIKKAAKKKGYKIQKDDDWQIIFEQIFLNEVEPHLPKDRPVFVYNYPKIMCPLVKTNSQNPNVCEKVELYIAGKEIANGYTELRDWKEQKGRFIEEQEMRKKLGKENIEFDYDLIEALKSGIPDVAGIGLGIDRLAAIFADAKSISEINYFPASEMFE